MKMRRRHPRISMRLAGAGLAALALAVGLGGCAGRDIQHKDGSRSARSYSVAYLAKAEADMLAEMNQKEVLKSLRLLTEKLYRRNPREYRKLGLESAEAASARLFAEIERWPDSPLARLDWESHFRLAFDDAYAGDRVHAYMGALCSMILAAYNHKTAFFLLDDLDAQRLYNSARNVEVAVWKLSAARQADGRRYLLANSVEVEAQNLSFEREFGKVIALQDMLALFVEDRGNRSITRVLQGAASLAFLPL